MKFTLYILFLSIVSYAQQNGQSSLYFFNQSFYNSAYISIDEGVSFVATGRNQWVNFKGAPKTTNLTVYSSFAKSAAGGLSVQIDQLGATRTSSFYGNFSYKIKFRKKTNLYAIRVIGMPQKEKQFNYLSFGLSFGVNNYQTFFIYLWVNDNTEADFIQGANYSQFTPNVGAAVLYYNNRLFLGTSVPTLLKNKLSSTISQFATEKRHLYVVAGVLKELNNGVIVRPSCVIKVVENAPVLPELGLSFLFDNKLWIGALVRGKVAVGAHLIYTTKSNLRIGYAYDHMLNSIQRFSVGSHEVMISYNVNKAKKRSLVFCPKF